MLDELREIRGLVRGATINDTVLAVCAGALRRYLAINDELPDDELTTMTAVYVRQPGDRSRVEWVHLTLGTNIYADPVSGIHRSSSSPWPSATDPTVSKVAHDSAFGGSGTCTTCHSQVPTRTNVSLHVNGTFTVNNTTAGSPEEYYTFATYTDAAANAGTCAGAAGGAALGPDVRRCGDDARDDSGRQWFPSKYPPGALL